MTRKDEGKALHDAERLVAEQTAAALRRENANEWRGFALLVADTCNDPHLVQEAERWVARLSLGGEDTP